MKLLQDKILKDGRILPGDVLKVDSFLNHQIDIELVDKCGLEWYNAFKDMGITKILTIEASGIGIACLAARHFNVPVVFAKKCRGSGMSSNVFSTRVISYTHGQSYDVLVSKRYLSADDKVLILDDFLANGSALKALINIANQAGATIVGLGAAIEKVYQKGGSSIREMVYRVDSLAKIKSMSLENGIEFE